MIYLYRAVFCFNIAFSCQIEQFCDSQWLCDTAEALRKISFVDDTPREGNLKYPV